MAVTEAMAEAMALALAQALAQALAGAKNLAAVLLPLAMVRRRSALT
jgi:hypothetical protein